MCFCFTIFSRSSFICFFYISIYLSSFIYLSIYLSIYVSKIVHFLDLKDHAASSRVWGTSEFISISFYISTYIYFFNSFFQCFISLSLSLSTYLQRILFFHIIFQWPKTILSDISVYLSIHLSLAVCRRSVCLSVLSVCGDNGQWDDMVKTGGHVTSYCLCEGFAKQEIERRFILSY